jgi:hypothetical protein
LALRAVKPALNTYGRLVIVAGPFTPFLQASIAAWRMPIAMHENGSSSGQSNNSGSSTDAATFSPHGKGRLYVSLGQSPSEQIRLPNATFFGAPGKCVVCNSRSKLILFSIRYKKYGH